MNLKEEFDKARKAWPGVKRGLEPEWDNFYKKNRKHATIIIPLLLPAIEKHLEWREKAKSIGEFVPPLKMFSTWINKQCWTQEYPEIQKKIEVQTLQMYEERRREQERDLFEEWLQDKTTEELEKLKGNKHKPIWLIDEILKERQ